MSFQHRGQPKVVLVFEDGSKFVQDDTPAQRQGNRNFPGMRAIDPQMILRQYRDESPARWRALMRAHFSCPAEVSSFFVVDSKTGRNWWDGVGRPTLDKALYAQREFPDSYEHYMISDDVKFAAE